MVHRGKKDSKFRGITIWDKRLKRFVPDPRGQISLEEKLTNLEEWYNFTGEVRRDAREAAGNRILSLEQERRDVISRHKKYEVCTWSYPNVYVFF